MLTSLHCFIRVRCTSSVVVISVRTESEPDTAPWEWEVPLVLWASMGTAQTACFVAQHYGAQYPHPPPPEVLLALSIAMAAALALQEDAPDAPGRFEPA